MGPANLLHEKGDVLQKRDAFMMEGVGAYKCTEQPQEPTPKAGESLGR